MDSSEDTHAQALARIGTPGIRFGLPALDGPLRGVKRGMLFLIGGPPAGGKTLLTTHLAANNLNLKIAWFTPDETHGYAVAKIAGLHFGMAIEDIERMLGTKRGIAQLGEYADTKLTNLFVSENPNANDVQAELARAARRWGGGPPDLFIWDYAELLEPGYPAGMNQKMDYFKQLIKVLNCHGVIIHQARKNASSSFGQMMEPTMDDLKEAGPAEAFQILFCRRTPTPTNLDKQREALHPTSEVWILKNKAAPGIPPDPITFHIGRGGRLSSSEADQLPTRRELKHL